MASSDATAQVRNALPRYLRRLPNLSQLLEDSDLSPGQRRYVEQRFDERLEEAALAERRQSALHNALKVIVILGGLVISALLAIDFAQSTLASALIGLVIAVAGALDDHFKLGFESEKAKKLVTDLEREGWEFVNLGGVYSRWGTDDGRSHAKVFEDFRRRLEGILDPESGHVMATSAPPG